MEDEEEEVVLVTRRSRQPPGNTAVIISSSYNDCMSSEPLNVKSTEEEVDKNEDTHVLNDLMGEIDEVIELELERAVEKVHTHIPCCPNCASRITKVVLRRRKREDTVLSILDNIHHVGSNLSDVMNGGHSNEQEQEVDKNDILRIHVCLDNNQVTTLQLSPLDNSLRVEDVHIPGLANAVINYLGNHVNNNDGGLNTPTLKQTMREEENIGVRPGRVNDNVRIDHLVEGSVEEGIELEFERAVEKVHTHTPYCPNCDSPITKVILRRKKRGSPCPDTPIDTFSCLSCFSFFIPTGNGFKLCRTFGEKSGKENARMDEKAPSVKKNWFTSIFQSNKQETTVEQGSGVQKGDAVLPSSNLGDQSGQPGVAEKQVISVSRTSVSVLKASDVDGKMNISVSIPHEEQDVRANIVTESVLENENANFSSSDSQVYPTGVSQHIITKTKIEAHSSESLEVDNISPLKDAAVGQGKDTVITIDSLPAVSSATAQGIIRLTETEIVSHELGTQSGVADSERTEARKKSEIEEIKSEVHGGLAESFTRPSVVSSAAGVGAATYGSGEGPTASTKSESEISEDDCPKSLRLPDETTQLVITSGQSKCETREQHNPNFQLLLGKYEGETIGYEYEKKALSSSRNIKKALGIRNKFRPIADSVPLYRLHMSGGGTNDPVTLQFYLNPDVLYQLFQR